MYLVNLLIFSSQDLQNKQLKEIDLSSLKDEDPWFLFNISLSGLTNKKRIFNLGEEDKRDILSFKKEKDKWSVFTERKVSLEKISLFIKKLINYSLVLKREIEKSSPRPIKKKGIRSFFKRDKKIVPLNKYFISDLKKIYKSLEIISKSVKEIKITIGEYLPSHKTFLVISSVDGKEIITSLSFEVKNSLKKNLLRLIVSLMEKM